MQHPFIKDFSSAVLNDSITNKYARENGSLIITLKGANEKMNQMFIDKIKKIRGSLNTNYRLYQYFTLLYFIFIHLRNF
ncbi:MAG: hypothetical protein ABIP30_15500 [Ferruginibacter sp.]